MTTSSTMTNLRPGDRVRLTRLSLNWDTDRKPPQARATVQEGEPFVDRYGDLRVFVRWDGDERTVDHCAIDLESEPFPG